MTVDGHSATSTTSLSPWPTAYSTCLTLSTGRLTRAIDWRSQEKTAGRTSRLHDDLSQNLGLLAGPTQ